MVHSLTPSSASLGNCRILGNWRYSIYVGRDDRGRNLLTVDVLVGEKFVYVARGPERAAEPHADPNW